MRPLKIKLLGGLTVCKGDKPLALPTQKIKSLFAYLVTYRDRSHPREFLAEIFWGDLGAEKARNNLRHALSILRRAFGPYLLIGRQEAGFNTSQAYWLDVEEFEGLIVRSRSLVEKERFRVLRQALELYKGDFLAGFYDDWVLMEQRRVQKLYMEALDALALWPGGPFMGAVPLGKREEAGLKHELARSHYYLRDPETALLFAQQALKLYEEIQDLIGQVTAHLLLGAIHRYLGQHPLASDHYQQALKLSRQTEDKCNEWQVLNNLGWLEWHLQNPKEALACYEQALPLCRRIGDRWGEAVVLNNCGIAYLDAQEYIKALDSFDRAYEAISALRNKELELENLSYRALAHLGLKAYDEVECCVQSVLELLEEGIEFRLASKVHLNLWRALGALGRPKEASQHLQLAYNDVMTRAGKIRDPTLRESFLQKDRINREILEAHRNASSVFI